MANGLLITMPNKQAHAALSILKQSRILAPDVTVTAQEVGAEHVATALAGSQCLPEQSVHWRLGAPTLYWLKGAGLLFCRLAASKGQNVPKMSLTFLSEKAGHR